MSRTIVATALLLVACGSRNNLKTTTLVEGRGTDSLVIGTTTLSQATKALGKAAGEPSTSGNETELDAPPLRLQFVTGEGGGEPVLQAVITFRKSNPAMPSFEGKTGRGVALLDSLEQMRAAYGEPDAEWKRTSDRVFYYTRGVVFTAEHPSQIPDYKGPPPEPLSGVITRIVITAPFEITGAPKTVQSGQMVVTSPPETTLRVSPF